MLGTVQLSPVFPKQAAQISAESITSEHVLLTLPAVHPESRKFVCFVSMFAVATQTCPVKFTWIDMDRIWRECLLLTLKAFFGRTYPPETLDYYQVWRQHTNPVFNRRVFEAWSFTDSTEHSRSGHFLFRRWRRVATRFTKDAPRSASRYQSWFHP